MAVYKKTCETGLIYYGSTKNEISIREQKGHYKCACKDFINPKMEVIEYIDDPKLRYEKELYYIRNFPCVNINGKGEELHREWRKNNKERIKENRLRSEAKCKIWEKFPCDICGKLTNKKHIKRHQQSQKCVPIIVIK